QDASEQNACLPATNRCLSKYSTHPIHARFDFNIIDFACTRSNSATRIIMVYTQNNPALFIIGLSMLAIGYGADTGLVDPVLAHLASGKSHQYRDELTTLPLYFGVFAAVTG